MQVKITTDNSDELEPHRFAAFASDVGLAPGQWPERLETTLGNKLPLLRRTKRVDVDGDVMYVRYEQANGCVELKIFNT